MTVLPRGAGDRSSRLSAAFARGEEVEGGIKYALNKPKVRIDYVYHAQSTLWQYLKAAEADPDLPAAVRAPLPPPLRGLFELQEMPFYRASGAPVRTSVPAADPSGMSVPSSSEVVDERDGAE
jgi:hypothetical protein